MEVLIYPDAAEATHAAALVVAGTVKRRPEAVLGLATGGTMEGLYAELRVRHDEGTLDLSGVTTFSLDEYVGLDASHPCSYHAYMRKHLFDWVGVPADRTNMLDGTADDMEAHCGAFEQTIERVGGIDVQLLGIGGDGHIGFNEPGSSLASRTRMKTLTESTRRDNARFFASLHEVPQHVLTMGIGTITGAREILLLALGDSKAQAVEAAVNGPVTASVPASALQFHPRVRVILDEPAAGSLSNADYHREVMARLPDWQRIN